MGFLSLFPSSLLHTTLDRYKRRLKATSCRQVSYILRRDEFDVNRESITIAFERPKKKLFDLRSLITVSGS
jgi:hypothetical protein